MKSLSKVLTLTMIALMFAAATCLAQDTASQNSDTIREKIEEMEKIDLQSKSTTVREIYKKSLLRLYQQFDAAVKLDLADLKKLQSTIGQTNPDVQKEISAQLQKLGAEQDVNTEKIKTLDGSLQSTTAAENGGPSSDGVGQDPKPANTGPVMPALSVAPLTKPISNSVNGSTTSASAASAATPPGAIKLCGQIYPASLVHVLALIQSTEIRDANVANSTTDLPKTLQKPQTRNGSTAPCRKTASTRTQMPRVLC